MCSVPRVETKLYPSDSVYASKPNLHPVIDEKLLQEAKEQVGGEGGGREGRREGREEGGEGGGREREEPLMQLSCSNSIVTLILYQF